MMDIDTPDMNGIEGTRRLKAIWPELRVVMVTVFEDPSTVLEAVCAGCDGYTVHAGVVIAARNRKGLEQLCRYIARPPLAKDRLEQLADGRVRIHLKRQWSDGTAAIDLTRLELIERLAALVPPPRAHGALYHGVLAARHQHRDRIPRPRPPKPKAPVLRLTRSPSRTSSWTPWAALLARVFGVDPLACPHCARPMRLRAIVLPPSAHGVLKSLQRSARAPPERRMRTPA
jgi:CheY-like chemotaxis protein